MKKLVSIGMPAYNVRSDFIRRALDSALSQTYSNFELIISDDASTDGTQNICKAYAKRDSRIRYIRHDNNIGPMRNFYFAFKQTQGEYFVWLADDDWWAPDFLEKLISALENNPDCGVAMCSFAGISGEGTARREILLEGDLDVNGKGYYEVYQKFHRMLGRYIYGLYRREFLEKFMSRPLPTGYSWEKIAVSEMALATHFCSIPEILLYMDSNKARKKNEAKQRQSLAVLRYNMIYFFFYRTFRSLGRVMTSPVVPFRRKLFVFIWVPGIAWLHFRKFFLRRIGAHGR